MKKSKIIILVILIAIIIAGVCVIVISKPSRELDKAIDYLKYGKCQWGRFFLTTF